MTVATPAVAARSGVRGRSEATIVEVSDRGAWEAYFDHRPADSVFHRWDWDTAFGTYGLRPLRLAAVRDGRFVGILPLVHQKSLIFGDRLVSLPWFDAAGVLADDQEAQHALVDEAVRRAEQLGVRDLELRQLESTSLSPHVRTDKVLMRLELEPNGDALWERLKPKVRNQVRKGEKSGLIVESGGVELVPEFFAVYSRNMRDLGSPSHALRFFEAVVRAFPETVGVHVARLDGSAVGAGMTIANGDRLEIPWASSLREHNALCVNHVLYWHLLREACSAEFRWFHFGRSTRDSGTYHFKKQWGAEEVPLHWYHFGPDAAAAVAKPSQESFGWAVAAWQRLPLWAARRLGPRVISRVA